MAQPNAPTPRDSRAPSARESIAPTRSDETTQTEDENVESTDLQPEVRMGGDIGFDRVVGADEAGLGGGLDQAEEAQLGITDEEIEQRLRERSGLK